MKRNLMTNLKINRMKLAVIFNMKDVSHVMYVMLIYKIRSNLRIM